MRAKGTGKRSDAGAGWKRGESGPRIREPANPRTRAIAAKPIWQRGQTRRGTATNSSYSSTSKTPGLLDWWCVLFPTTLYCHRLLRRYKSKRLGLCHVESGPVAIAVAPGPLAAKSSA